MTEAVICRCSSKQVFLKTGLQTYNFIKKRFQYRFFPVKFAKFLRTLFLQIRIVGFLRPVNGRKMKTLLFLTFYFFLFLQGFFVIFPRFPRKSKNRLNTSVLFYGTPLVAASGMILTYEVVKPYLLLDSNFFSIYVVHDYDSLGQGKSPNLLSSQSKSQ